MKRVASVSSIVPHSSASGRGGLDALLATSALAEDPGVPSTDDGVFQVLQGQQPDAVLAQDCITIFKPLGLYDIDRYWLCVASLRERGLQQGVNFVVDTTALEPEGLCRELDDFNVILKF